MAVSWLKAIGAAPAMKRAVDALVAPGAGSSKTVWYNLIKAGVTMATAFGLYLYLTEEEIETISSLLAIAVPTMLTLFDMAANLWLRTRTKESLEAKVSSR